VYCSHCEKDMPNDFKYCPVCGSPPAKKSSPPPGEYSRQFNPPPPQPKTANYSQNTPQYPVGYKGEGTALILAIVLGLFGLCGIGHLYVGKIGRGIGILIGNWVLLGIGVATAVFLIGIPFLIGALVLFIWQIIDARNLCREYNDYLANNGRPPW